MHIDTGDTAWIMVSAALVMIMLPGVAFFYGGMVRRKNILSTLMMSFAAMAVVGIIWVVYGYSLGFGPDRGGFLGGLEWAGLASVGQDPSDVYATTVPHLAFMVFQAMFAMITVSLITGGIVERVKFSAFLLFTVLWVTIVYCPISHWVWGDGGWLLALGALDFAGGSVVHINAGMSALALAMILRPRKGYIEGETMEPHNLPMVLLGASLLWFGWFGFNGGSALASGGLASAAFVNTNISAAAAAVTWMVISWIYRRPSLLGITTGAVAGLVAITPASGFVSPMASILIGCVASVICYYCILFRTKRKIDESLDVWAVHGMGGVWGAIATGLFATVAVNPNGANGLFLGNAALLGKQVVDVLAVAVFSFGLTWILAKIIDRFFGLRVKDEEESVGLDISQHGERAYGGV